MKMDLDKFRTNSADEYIRDEPLVLVCSTSKLAVGVNLCPSDAMILVDHHWQVAKVIQFSGRVRRIGTTQKAKFTELVRLVVRARDKNNDINTRVCRKHNDKQALTKELQRGVFEDAADEEEELANGTTKATGIVV